MPTREETESVIRQIEELQSQRFGRDSNGNLFLSGEKGWGDLSLDERRDALAELGNWKGFTHAEEEDVVRRVLDGEEPDFWMDGVVVGGPDDERPTKTAAEAYLIVPYQRNFDPDAAPYPGKEEDASFYRVFSYDRGNMGFVDDLDTLAEAHARVRSESNGRTEGRLFEAVSFYHLPFGCWPDIKPIITELRAERDAAMGDNVITPEETKALAAEIRADEYAARVRHYGEADAASYDQRVQEGAMMPPLTAGPPDTWPSEIARAQRQHKGEQDHGKGKAEEQIHGKDDGNSM